MRVETVNKRQFLLSKFKELFPYFYGDGMMVSEAGDTLIVNPTPGKRGARYYFKYSSDKKWELKYE